MNHTLAVRSDEADRYILYAKLDNAKILYNLAKAVNFKDVSPLTTKIYQFNFNNYNLIKHAVFCALENGLKISCEDAKCTQGVAFVHADLFQDYSVKEDCILIKINLAILIECLNIFGSTGTAGLSTALKLCYEGYGHPLMLM